jgi:hypothetical protein
VIAVEVLISDVLTGWAMGYLFISVAPCSGHESRRRCGFMQLAWMLIFMMVYVQTFSVDLDDEAIVACASVLRFAER